MRICGALSKPSFALMTPLMPWRRKVSREALGFCSQFLHFFGMGLIIVCFETKNDAVFYAASFVEAEFYIRSGLDF